MKFTYVLFVLLCFVIPASSQEVKEVKFGKIDKNDLLVKSYPIDTNANAVVLYEKGEVSFVPNNNGFFAIQYNIFKRIHILKKAGYGMANVEVPLYYSNGADERCDNIKAVTYNLENNQVVESNLDNKSVFLEKVDFHNQLKKFTLPNVKEGSIIDYKYAVTSDFIFYIDPWYFQSHKAPKLWSEYTVNEPYFFDYLMIPKGNQLFAVNKKTTKSENYSIRENSKAGSGDQTTFSCNETRSTWVMKDVPELKVENFSYTPANFLSAVEFKLSAIRQPLTSRDLKQTWQDATNKLMGNENFGAGLYNSNNWLDDEVSPLLKAGSDKLATATMIYNYVRDNYKCTGKPQSIYLSQSLKTTFNTHKGSVPEINLLLAAIYRHAGYDAEPVILSTTDNGYTFPLYPILTKFNYVVIKVRINNTNYFLDATQPLKFGIMQPACYNGHARVVNENANPMAFLADSIINKSMSSLYMTYDSTGSFQGRVWQTPGIYSSSAIRKSIKESSEDDYFKTIKKGVVNDIEYISKSIDSANNPDVPLKIKYSFKTPPEKANILYFNPMAMFALKSNPFYEENRKYPIELPYKTDETFFANMIVPAGYKIDELPVSMKLKLDDEENGYFDYVIDTTATTIAFKSVLKINRAYFHAEDYELLREFYKMVLKKQNEQIVFKKK